MHLSDNASTLPRLPNISQPSALGPNLLAAPAAAAASLPQSPTSPGITCVTLVSLVPRQTVQSYAIALRLPRKHQNVGSNNKKWQLKNVIQHVSMYCYSSVKSKSYANTSELRINYH